MPFNGPIDGDYTNVDFGKAPWTQECMVLTHEECVQVKEKITEIEQNFDPVERGSEMTDMLIHSDYNKSDWQYAISWSTYLALKQYDPEVHKDGINENGIVEQYEPIEGPAE